MHNVHKLCILVTIIYYAENTNTHIHDIRDTHATSNSYITETTRNDQLTIMYIMISDNKKLLYSHKKMLSLEIKVL